MKSLDKGKMGLAGCYTVELIRGGKVIHREVVPNGITDVGIDDLFSSGFQDAASKRTGWAIGLIDNAGFTALAAADTMASHAGWVESTAYDEATRVAWNPAAASGKSISNSSARTFTLSATGTIYGVFVSSNNTKGGTTGILFSTAAFSAPIPVNDDDTIQLTYTLTGASA